MNSYLIRIVSESKKLFEHGKARLTATGLLLIPIVLLIWCFIPVPSDKLEWYPQSFLLYSRDGRLLREAVNNAGARAIWFPVDSMAPCVISAILAAEDKRFYSHPGIDPFAVTRSIGQVMVKRRASSGASTITMQTARLLYGCSHSLFGKVQQALYALRLERTLSKKEILEQYLNRAEFGAGCIGVEAASRRYFGKSVARVSTAEAALLASLPKAPTILNPLKNPDGARKRQLHVLQRMVKNGTLSIDEFRRDSLIPLNIGRVPPELNAMHFTDFVLSQSPPPGKITTTLDLDLQIQLEKIVADHVAALKKDDMTNAAVIVIDNNSGGIRAMVGSAGYRDEPAGSVNGTIALRQPGSTLKPFTYALAFESGKTPASVVADVETDYIGTLGQLFSPRNFSRKFNGPVLMSEALGRSLNVPAIRTLNYVGIDPLLKRLHLSGFESLTENAEFYGLGLTLGNGEVTLLELAQGYAMFARGGFPLKVSALTGKENPPQGERVFSEETCYLITDILSDEMLRIKAFGPANPLLFGFPFACKTGTSANWRDSWVVGYCKEYAVAVWAGDFAGGVMNRLSGSTGAGPLFNKVVQLMVYGHAVPKIPDLPRQPPDIVRIDVCPISGMLPGECCPNTGTVCLKKDMLPRETCNVHRRIRIDKRNGLLASDCCPKRYVREEVFAVLPSRFAQWQAQQSLIPVPPHTWSPLCPQAGVTSDALVITSPRSGERYIIEPGYNKATQTIALKGEADPPIGKINWEIDGRVVAQSEWPYTTAWRLAKGTHSIRMSGGGMKSDPVEIVVE